MEEGARSLKRMMRGAESLAAVGLLGRLSAVAEAEVIVVWLSRWVFWKEGFVERKAASFSLSLDVRCSLI